jgi:hypothetical protein
MNAHNMVEIAPRKVNLIDLLDISGILHRSLRNILVGGETLVNRPHEFEVRTWYSV